MNSRQEPLKLAVIGHTNTGKTSVLRSLLRKWELGEVRDEAGTTKENEPHELRLEGEVRALLYDTPGFEDAASVLEEVRRVKAERKITGWEALSALFAQPPKSDSAVVARDLLPLDALANCDAGLLVFDVRQKPREKHREELELLRLASKPMVPVLNVCANEDEKTKIWEETLRSCDQHAIMKYDAWVASEDDAQRLFIKIRELLGDDRSGLVDTICELRQEEHRNRVHKMAKELATLLVDAAAYELVIKRDIVKTTGQEEALRDWRNGWLGFRQQLARDYSVPSDRIERIQAEIYKLYDRSCKVFALGAKALGRHAIHRVAGKTEVRFSDDDLCTMFCMGVWLIERLQSFGHASEDPIDPDSIKKSELDNCKRLFQNKVLPQLRKARGHPRWSRLQTNKSGAPPKGDRPERATKIAGKIAETITNLLEK